MPDIVIEDGNTFSDPYGPADDLFSDALAIGLVASAGLAAAAYVIQVTHDFVTPVWVTLEGGSPIGNIAPPADTKARVYIDILTFAGFRILAPAPVTGDQTWHVVKNWRNF
jgi:hypothetical protein